MISLSAGSVLDAAPAVVLRAAATAGYDAAGLRLDPDRVTTADVVHLRELAADLGITLLDLEVVRLGPQSDRERERRIVDLAATLGAEFVLTVSEHDSEAASADALGELTEVADASGVRLALEFMMFTGVHTLAAALRVVTGTTGAVVVDALHLHRSGADSADLSAIPRQQLAYVQLCDASLTRPNSTEALAHEARHERLVPGAGRLPLAQLLSAVPADVPLTVEVQSDDLSSRLAPTPRAVHLLEHTRRVLPVGHAHARSSHPIH